MSGFELMHLSAIDKYLDDVSVGMPGWVIGSSDQSRFVCSSVRPAALKVIWSHDRALAELKKINLLKN
jgi:hypothetical protein